MVGMLSDIGNVRKVNEDYYGFLENHNNMLYIIADGMGGHNAGELASKIAVENTIQFISSSQQIEDVEKMLLDAINSSNNKIYQLSNTDVALKGMGTTITACYVTKDKLLVANVGDSRCYVIINEGLYQVTKDHSLVQQLVDDGLITKEEAVHHPNKNIITRSLGTAPKVEVDLFSLDINNISKVMLCTDGLTNSIGEEEILKVINTYNSEEACKKLIELSKENGGRDNITVIIFEGECNNGRDFT